MDLSPHNAPDAPRVNGPAPLEAAPPREPRPADAPARAARRSPELGDLVDEDQDHLVVHTREAMHLFEGRVHDQKAQVNGIIGGRRAAAAARAIWLLSASDNPYAEWGLLSTSAALDGALRAIDEAVAAREQEIEALRQRGLGLTVQRSRQPAQLDIGFRSPYGYAIAELVLRFDYAVRLVKSLVRKDRLTEDQGRDAIAAVRRHCRAAFEVAVRFERVLVRPEMRALSRSDFLPTADEAAQQRVQAAVAQFGELPRDVFTGQLRPRHTRRRERPSAVEARLLASLDLSGRPSAEARSAAVNTDPPGLPTPALAEHAAAARPATSTAPVQRAA